MTKLIYLSLFLLVVLACKDDHNESAINVTPDNFCSEVAEVLCTDVYLCCEDAEIAENLGSDATERTCREEIELKCEDEYSEELASAGNETVVLKVEEVNACLTSLIAAEGECFPMMADFGSECPAEFFEGVLGAGGACATSLQCDPGHRCGTDKTCVALPVLGEPCLEVENDPDCAPGLYCSVLDSKCRLRQAQGAECDTRQAHWDCEEGLVCIEAQPGAGFKCSHKKAVGEACDSDDVCQSGSCPPGTCDDGTPCESNEDCPGTGCPGYCYIDPSITCLTNDDCRMCSNTCQDGTPCAIDTDCTDGLGCTETCTNYGCVLPDDCYGTCTGNVCAENLVSVSFCPFSPEFPLGLMGVSSEEDTEQ